MTSPALPFGRWRAIDTLAVLARWSLGAVFVYMGLGKALQPVEFLKLARQYDILPQPLLLNVVAAALPWFEVFCGLLLALGVAVRGTAALLVAMLVPFTAAVLLRALSLSEANGLPLCAVKFDCGCGTGEVLICWKLAENVLFIALSGWLICLRNHRLCLRPNLL